MMHHALGCMQFEGQGDMAMLQDVPEEFEAFGRPADMLDEDGDCLIDLTTEDLMMPTQGELIMHLYT